MNLKKYLGGNFLFRLLLGRVSVGCGGLGGGGACVFDSPSLDSYLKVFMTMVSTHL